MATPQLDLIGIVVADMARSLAYYHLLGLAVPAEADTQPHVEATLPGGTRVAWDALEAVRSFDPDHPAPPGPGGIGLAFRLATPAEVDDTYERLVAAGHHGHKAPWDAVWGQRYALLRDPDGNSTDLFAPLP